MIVDEAEAVLLGLQPDSKPLQSKSENLKSGSKELSRTESSAEQAAAMENVMQEEGEGKGGAEKEGKIKAGIEEDAGPPAGPPLAGRECNSSLDMIRILENFMKKQEEELEEKCALHRGMAITEQLACVQAFRRGHFHVLVSTQVILFFDPLDDRIVVAYRQI